VPAFASDHVEVFLFRRRGRRAEFLALRRAQGRLAGVWQPVTGSRAGRETALAAARREVREETGLDPLRWWRLEDVALYFDPEGDAFRFVPRFAAELAPRARVSISPEHDRCAFLAPGAAARRYLWASQRRALAHVCEDIVPDGATARALEITARGGTPRRIARRRT
jgi:dATP pyrophosphohydrolase